MNPRFKLDNYEITSIIGRGTMGIVYKAFDTTIQQVVAIKTIRKDLLEVTDQGSLQAKIAERFRSEVLAGRRLKHANIVRIFEYGDTEDCYYIVMEFVQGRTLAEYFNEGHRFDLDSVLEYMLQILDALGYAHSQGVIHRDIKPANVMLAEQHCVQIADFGVAKVFDTGSSTLTGYAVGTPSYMAPEQWEVDKPSDARADLFSAGIILYQFLTGRHPFRGATTAETIDKIRSTDPVAPSTLAAGIPPAFDAVMVTALQKDPLLRYQKAEAFAQQLRAIQATRRSTKTPAPSRGRHPWQSVLLLLGSVGLGSTLAWLVGSRFATQTNVVSNPETTVVAGTAPPEASIAASLKQIVARFPCAHVEIVAPASGERSLRGFVAPDDIERLKSAIADTPHLAHLPAQIRALAWPYCELLDVLFPYKRGEKWEFAEERNTRHYVDGDPLVLALTAPNYEAHVYVDYYQLDGSVVHLFPLRPEQNQRQAPNSRITIGNTADGGHEWHIQAPFGTEMIVVMAATEPLFGIQRPEHEHAKDYLGAVRAAFAEAADRRITADYYFIQSRAKRTQD
jgi:eukaryotic-like serine/threonine-protein kinase